LNLVTKSGTTTRAIAFNTSPKHGSYAAGALRSAFTSAEAITTSDIVADATPTDMADALSGAANAPECRDTAG
jgi:hypothetical protein